MKGINRTHGHANPKSPTYKSWANMKRRCLDPKYPNARYHARWYAPWDAFEVFLADMGERPEGMTIERIDNALPYGPSNCRWATSLDQIRNSPATKLSAEQVAEIRAIGFSLPRLTVAKRYGVTRQQISTILHVKTWKQP